ncbi:hypothetical protein WJU23_19720 [Prosthecobacter sp. SYSU 5D2]|uniref:DUF1398 domain-containing protein n=1 Tax=Prosthecobacter sp. SYSU 5D2 TaxID=3134134 RepID=UPI0031FEADF1
MNATRILKSARQTLAGKQSFPEAVACLMSEGVEYYHVDYATLKKSFYDGAGGVVTAPIVYEGLPEIEAEFSAADLQANIRDSQLHGQNFRDFTQRAMKAGVQSYYAFLRGGRVTYLGRQGDQHVEWFPGMKPE